MIYHCDVTEILVTNNIIGDSVFISEPTFILDMAKKEKLICKNITVSLVSILIFL